MGERKVLNKYYPPDFDPAKIPRRKQDKNKQIKVRMMLPMSIRCNTCGTYIYKGTKFNSRKEDVVGETYLGIQIFRFYFKCTKCSAELTMKTDPQNSDYVVEAGAARNFEPWRNEEEATENQKRKRDAEEMGDAMKTLENKALDSKQEMDILATLEEVKSMNVRHEKVSYDTLLGALKRSDTNKEVKEVEIDEVDNAIIKSIVFHNSKDHVRRIHDDDEDDDVDEPADLDKPKDCSIKGKGAVGNPTDSLATASIFNSSQNAGGTSLLPTPKFLVKPRSTTNAVMKRCLEAGEDKSGDEQSKNYQPKITNGLQSLLQSYDNDDSE